MCVVRGMNTLNPASWVPDRLAVPALFAAAFHAALLFGFAPIVRGPVSVAEKPEPTTVIPAQILDLLRPVEPPAEENVATPAVKQLATGPARPETADRSSPVVSEWAAPRPVPVPGIAISADLKTIPKVWGDGESGERSGERMKGTPIFSLGDLDRVPRARVQPAPEYPAAMRAAGVEGEVVVEFAVDATGHVTTAQVVRSTQREFEEPALRAVRKWRFEPGRKDGRAVPFRMAVPIGFRLGAD